MQLEAVAIPTVVSNAGRTAEPNPFIDGEFAAAVKALPMNAEAGTKGAALSLVVPGVNDVKGNKELAKVIRQLNKAAAAREATFKKTLEGVTVNKVPSTRVTFWAVTKVDAKPRTPKATEAASETE